MPEGRICPIPRSQSNRRRRRSGENERTNLRYPAGIIWRRKRERASAFSPTLPGVLLPLVASYQRCDSRGRKIVCLERPFKTPLRPFVILARSRGTLLTSVEGSELGKDSVRLLNVTRRSQSYEGGRARVFNPDELLESSRASFEF